MSLFFTECSESLERGPSFTHVSTEHRWVKKQPKGAQLGLTQTQVCFRGTSSPFHDPHLLPPKQGHTHTPLFLSMRAKPSWQGQTASALCQSGGPGGFIGGSFALLKA